MDCFRTISNPKVEQNNSKAMATQLPRATDDSLQQFLEACYFVRAIVRSHTLLLVERASHAILQGPTFIFILYNKTCSLAVNEENIPCALYRTWEVGGGWGDGRCEEGKGMIVVDVEVVMNFSPNYP